MCMKPMMQVSWYNAFVLWINNDLSFVQYKRYIQKVHECYWLKCNQISKNREKNIWFSRFNAPNKILNHPIPVKCWFWNASFHRLKFQLFFLHWFGLVGNHKTVAQFSRSLLFKLYFELFQLANLYSTKVFVFKLKCIRQFWQIKLDIGFGGMPSWRTTCSILEKWKNGNVEFFSSIFMFKSEKKEKMKRHLSVHFILCLNTQNLHAICVCLLDE